jgi:ATP-binding cassette subfamily F protein 3
MAILNASYIGQSFGAFDVFQGISVSIPNDGKVGLVGPNGIGKTTLLLILAGISQPATGNVHVARNTQIGYLPQESAQAFAGQEHTVYEEMLTIFEALRADETRLRRLEATMAAGDFSDELLERYSQLQEQFEVAGGYDYELRIKQVLTGLGFNPSDWALPLSHLSGGQKTRALLARLLLEQPNLLILDEPTNHLDVEAVEWLEGALKVWEGAVLLVSHDRYFLDKVSNTIWEMNRTGIELYRGNYTAYVQQRQERWARQEQEFAAMKLRMEKEMDFIRRNMAGQRTQMAQGKLNRLSREVEAVRVGGLGVLSVLRSRGWLQLSSEMKLKRPAASLAELQQQVNALPGPTKPPTLNMKMQASHRSGNIVLRTKALRIGYPGSLLFTAEDIELRRQECAALIGPNGSGKTSFLRTVLQRMPPLAGAIQLGASLQIGYFAQGHDELNQDNTILEELLHHHPMNTSEARNYLARYLFRQDDVFKKISTLSGGEQGRLALAILALQKTNFLLLDEPTNHLDIPSQEVLQEVLEQYEGTVLLVSHDRYLVNLLASQIWELEEGRLRVYPGDYQQYLEVRERETAAWKETEAMARAAAADAQVPANGASPSKNALRRQAEALAEVESLIHEMESRLARISEALQQATQVETFDKIQSLSVEYTATETQLASLLEQWERLAHE